MTTTKESIHAPQSEMEIYSMGKQLFWFSGVLFSLLSVFNLAALAAKLRELSTLSRWLDKQD